MYPMTTQPASDLRHNIWSLAFSRLGQSTPYVILRTFRGYVDLDQNDIQ